MSQCDHTLRASSLPDSARTAAQKVRARQAGLSITGTTVLDEKNYDAMLHGLPCDTCGAGVGQRCEAGCPEGWAA